MKLVVCLIVLATVCCAQEHLTCSRTDGVSNQTSQTALQGFPGKRGPKGQMGSRGSPGHKGIPGYPDNHQINLLRNQVNSLSQEVEALKTQSRENRQLVVDVFKKRLYVPPHVYIYQLTPGYQSWQESQQFCQNWGGTLAVFGVKTRENRKKLMHVLSTNYYFWIGANDIASEGNWVWVNGERASSSELIWMSGQPNNFGGNEDCVVVYGSQSSSDAARARDYPCTNSYQGLCEKQL